MKAYYDKDKKSYDFSSKDVSSLLKELKILSNTVIVVVNKKVVTKDYVFKEEDEVNILSVVSGG